MNKCNVRLRALSSPRAAAVTHWTGLAWSRLAWPGKERAGVRLCRAWRPGFVSDSKCAGKALEHGDCAVYDQLPWGPLRRLVESSSNITELLFQPSPPTF